MSLAKSNALMRGLREKLVLRLPSTYLFADSVDAAGNPVLTIAQKAPWVTADQYVVIRMRPITQIGANVLGLAQESFGPHDIDFISEASGVATETFLSDLNSQKILFELDRIGAAINVYLMPTTTLPTTAGMIAGNLTQRIDDLLNPELITV